MLQLIDSVQVPLQFDYVVSVKCVSHKEFYYYDASNSFMTCALMSRVVLYYFLIPIILGIFSALTIYNIHKQVLLGPVVNQGNLYRPTERQLARILIIQVTVYFLFFTPSGITYILLTFVPSMNTSVFFYILSGKIYREEQKKMLK